MTILSEDIHTCTGHLQHIITKESEVTKTKTQSHILLGSGWALIA